MKNIMEKISKDPRCVVYPASGRPIVEIKYRIPEDLYEFYRLCGGVSLYRASNYSIDIVKPIEFVLSNINILGERYPDDISSDWFIICKSGLEQAISIDLNEKRLGRCYDSFHEVHAVAGSCKVLSMNFTELLKNLYDSNGDYWFWLNDKFSDLGDAYD